ncbi:MAG: oligosaccharide flippase family protein [Erysipelotrichaceae bacterium]|nr:oligosaccharide flippase family protein [Erysipelotrichaceae bacterium]
MNLKDIDRNKTNVKNKEKSLLKNTGILALGTLSSKIFMFLLLPLYTAALSAEDYGGVDLLQTIASFIIPFVTLQLSSAMFRFIIEKKDEHRQSVVITTAIILEVINIFIFMIFVFIINIFSPIRYCLLFVVYFILLVTLEMVQNIVRGFGNNILYSAMSFVMTVVSLVTNIILILGFGMKGESILIASSLSYFIVIVLGFFKQELWKYIRYVNFSFVQLKEMLAYCLPLIPNEVSWWVANASDRILVSYFIGAANNGIYAAANKIPTIYTTIYKVYNTAWVESLSRSFGDDDQYEFINNMYSKSLKLFGSICLGIISVMSLIFSKIIGINYAESYTHIYILMIAILFNSICSLYGGIFTAFKKSGIIGKTTVIGAVINILINILLIRFIGLYAASISTLVSYIVIFITRHIEVKKIMDLKWPKIYVVQFIFMFIITTTGYFLRINSLNFIVLSVLCIWSYFSNKELIDNIVITVYNKSILKLFKG